jgi:hypothetical protein
MTQVLPLNESEGNFAACNDPVIFRDMDDNLPPANIFPARGCGGKMTDRPRWFGGGFHLEKEADHLAPSSQTNR